LTGATEKKEKGEEEKRRKGEKEKRYTLNPDFQKPPEQI